MSFFDPLLTSEGKPFVRARFEQIITEQVTLGYLTKGGITYGDSEQMSPHERHLALESITRLLEEQAEAQKKAFEEANQNPQ